MARGDLLCPNCNQPLTLPVFTRTDTTALGLETGEHTHFTVSANGVCTNGHRWLIEQGDLVLRRIV